MLLSGQNLLDILPVDWTYDSTNMGQPLYRCAAQPFLRQKLSDKLSLLHMYVTCFVCPHLSQLLFVKILTEYDVVALALCLFYNNRYYCGIKEVALVDLQTSSGRFEIWWKRVYCLTSGFRRWGRFLKLHKKGRHLQILSVVGAKKDSKNTLHICYSGVTIRLAVTLQYVLSKLGIYADLTKLQLTVNDYYNLCK